MCIRRAPEIPTRPPLRTGWSRARLFRALSLPPVLGGEDRWFCGAMMPVGREFQSIPSRPSRALSCGACLHRCVWADNWFSKNSTFRTCSSDSLPAREAAGGHTHASPPHLNWSSSYLPSLLRLLLLLLMSRGAGGLWVCRGGLASNPRGGSPFIVLIVLWPAMAHGGPGDEMLYNQGARWRGGEGPQLKSATQS